MVAIPRSSAFRSSERGHDRIGKSAERRWCCPREQHLVDAKLANGLQAFHALGGLAEDGAVFGTLAAGLGI